MKKVKFIFVALFIFFSVLIIWLFKFIEKSESQNLKVPGVKNTPCANTLFSNHKSYSNITLKPYGCFSDLKNQFFLECINPYDSGKLDSGIFISADDTTKELKELINKVIKVGFSKYGNEILKKYQHAGETTDSITLLETATLAKLIGYNFISVYRTDIDSKYDVGKIYLTYSAPTVSSSIYKYSTDISESDFDDIKTQSDLPELNLTPRVGSNEPSCGIPCITYGKPETFTDLSGNVRQYMCGSTNYPTLKTGQRYAVYEIIGTPAV